jgi:transcriptional regulator with XRE-family HTH domain
MGDIKPLFTTESNQRADGDCQDAPMDTDTYAKRLHAAMARANMTVSSLAHALGLSYQGVRKVADGKSKSFSTENNSEAARILGVRPNWLATVQESTAPASGALHRPPAPGSRRFRPDPSLAPPPPQPAHAGFFVPIRVE